MNRKESYSHIWGYVKIRVAINIVREMHQCMVVVRVTAYQIIVKQSQWKGGASLHLFRLKKGPSPPSSTYASLFSFFSSILICKE